MERPDLTFKIEIFGNLVDELGYWATESNENDIEIAEIKFDETLAAVKEMRSLLLEDLEEYERNCKLNNEPIFLSYRVIKKELEKHTFEI